LADDLYGRGGEFLQFSQSVLGNVTLILAVFAISFYLLVDHKGVERFLREILPDRYEGPLTEIFLRARDKLGYWLQAQILLSFFIGVSVAVGLYILGVEHALLLGIIAGIFEIVPFVGPVLTGTISVLVAMSQSFNLGIYTIILFVLIQQVENNLLVPVFMKRAVGVHPVAILVSLLVGANLFGFVGIILAVPITVFAQEFIDDWALRKVALREGRKGIE
jgi:predicted PurR-regulated permease PerM